MSEPHRSATSSSNDYHYVCNPGGTVAGNGNPPNVGARECGFATFRIHCAEPSHRVAGTPVNFRFEMSFPAVSADGRAGTDDSFYTSMDGNRVWDTAGDDVTHCQSHRIVPHGAMYSSIWTAPPLSFDTQRCRCRR